MRNLVVAFAAMLMAGCATMGDTPAAPPPGVFSAPMTLPPKGTRWVMKSTVLSEKTAKSQAQTMTWTALGDGLRENKPVFRIWDGARLHIRDHETGSWLATLDRNARETMASEPHDGDFSSPLWVGKQWVARFTRHERYRNQSHYNVTVVWKVEAFEDVTVPAGSFKAFRISAWPDARDSVKKHVLWYAPDVKLVVKEMKEGLGRDASLVVRDVGDGALALDFAGDRVRSTRELVSYTSPADLVPPLIAAIGKRETRLEALWDIARIGPMARDALPALIDVLVRDPDTLHRNASVSAVRAVGITATNVDALVPALADADVNVRIATADMLKPHAGDARVILERRLRDTDVEKRDVVVRALGGLARVAPVDVLPVLGTALDDPESRVRVLAVESIGEAGVPAMAALRGALRHRDPGVRAMAVLVIIGVPEQQPVAIAAIIDVLDDGDTAVRTNAVHVLGSMGPLATQARERLARVAEQDPSPEIRELAKRALADIPAK